MVVVLVGCLLCVHQQDQDVFNLQELVGVLAATRHTAKEKVCAIREQIVAEISAQVATVEAQMDNIAGGDPDGRGADWHTGLAADASWLAFSDHANATLKKASGVQLQMCIKEAEGILHAANEHNSFFPLAGKADIGRLAECMQRALTTKFNALCLKFLVPVKKSPGDKPALKKCRDLILREARFLKEQADLAWDSVVHAALKAKLEQVIAMRLDIEL